MITNHSDLIISAQKENRVYSTDYVVHIYLRRYYDQKDGKYDKESEFNLSGFNDNSKWDSIFMLTQFIEKQNPRFWWFDNKNNPKSVTIRFYNENDAQACYKELEKKEYGSVIQRLRLEKFIPHRKRRNK
jgi:hypothetical protein